MINKKGVSAVVATVLIVLITIAAVSIIAGFIIPMVREGLEEGGSCFDLRDYVKITDLGYTCYDSAKTSLTIERGMENHSIQGFVVSITSGPASKRYDLKQGLTTTGATMYDGSTVIKIPEPGGAETYTFNIGNGNKADLGIMISGEKVCEMDSFTIPLCT